MEIFQFVAIAYQLTVINCCAINRGNNDTIAQYYQPEVTHPRLE